MYMSPRFIKELMALLMILLVAVGSFSVYKYITRAPADEPTTETPADPEHVHKESKVNKETLSPSTCTDSGFVKETATCSCGAIVSEVTKSTPPTGHKMVGNSCKNCDYLTTSEGFNYQLVGNAYYAIVGLGSNSDTHVILPDTYEGLPVGAIGAGVFSGKAITAIEIPDSVTSIGKDAFKDCTSLATVSLGDSVTYIGEGAFDNCSALAFTTHDNAKYLGNERNEYLALISATDEDITSCEIHENTKVIAGGAFADCGLLRSVQIPDRVKTVGERAFYNCTNLLSVTVGKSLKNVYEDAFLYCHKLVEIYNLSDELLINKGLAANGNIGLYALDVYKSAGAVSKLVKNADGYVFYEGAESYLIAYQGESTALTLPEKNTVGGSYAMYSHTFSNLPIESVTVAKGLTSVGTYAFRNCEQLATVSLPTSLNRLESGAFEGCVSLGSISIPTAVNYIGSHAFEGCKALTSVVIPASVTKIENNTFKNCAVLSTVTLNGSATEIGAYAFYGCKALTGLKLSGVKAIGDYAFYGCKAMSSADLSTVNTLGAHAFAKSGLTALTLSASLTSVGEMAFESCATLSSVSVPDRSKTLTFGDGVFADCAALKSISLGNKISAISDGMLRGCVSLTDVTLNSGIVKIGDQAFYNC